jgi:hypothetical protein
MVLKLKKESALNLTLEGSIGSFSVGNGRDTQNSIEVKYFLTHVGLSTILILMKSCSVTLMTLEFLQS